MREIKAYSAKDGTVFIDKLDCVNYEGLVVCDDCNGKGEISYEKDTYPEGLPDSGWATRMETFWMKCPKCVGLGYIDNIKVDPEYEEFLRLQEKFKDIE